VSYFYKLNQAYINAFQNNVRSRFTVNNIKSDVTLLKAILQEVTELFRKVGGQMSSKRLIPHSGDYPNSILYNKLVTDIGFDIGKLYNAQAILESDLVNVMNYNSTQRDKTFENLAAAQQTVYSAYIKSKRDLMGGTEIPTENPFTSSLVGMDAASNGVFIDSDRSCLTLASTAATQRIADTKDVAIYFAGDTPEEPIYPLGSTLGVGHHWLLSKTDPHFIDQTKISDVEQYKQMMVDDPTSNMSVGYCEFEAVETIGSTVTQVSNFGEYVRLSVGIGQTTINSTQSYAVNTKSNMNFVFAIKKYLGDHLGLDPYLIYLDSVNSFQGQYIKTSAPITGINFTSNSKFKLIIPFNQSILTDQINVEFMCNNLGLLPNVDWANSKVFSNVGGTESSYDLLDPGQTSSQEGRFVCKIVNFTYPTRLELMLTYPGTAKMWSPMPFYMSQWVYSDYKSDALSLATTTGKNIQLTVVKVYDIFVDSEANQVNERRRALNVLQNPNLVA